MTNNANEENLIRNIEDYVNQKGWSSFFGLLATISPHKTDSEDLKRHEEKIEQEVTGVEQPQVEELVSSNNVTQEVQEASIYAPEHIPAVQDDLREQGVSFKQEPKGVNEPKKKVLEQQRSSAPNPWGDAEVVSPGQLNL